MADRHVYVTLPSNTRDYTQRNKTNSFRVQLPEPLQLQGKWEVALVDFQYPLSWRNIAGKHTIRVQYVTKSGQMAWVQGEIPPGYYADIDTLVAGVKVGIRDAARSVFMIDAADALSVHCDDIRRNYSTGETTVRFTFRDGLPASLREQMTVEEIEKYDQLYENYVNERRRYLDGKTRDAEPSELEHALTASLTPGLGRLQLHIQEGKSINAIELPETVRYMLGIDETRLEPGTIYQAKYQPDLTGGLTTLYVHCNIVEPQIVGNTKSELLRTVPVNSTKRFGDTVHELFTSPHYVNVRYKNFDNIRIEIRSDSGEPIPFEYGKVIAKLHLRKSKGF